MDPGQGKQLNDFLAKFDVRSIIEEQDTFVVETDSGFVEVLRCMATHEIRAIPVYERSRDTFIGLIDTLDVVSFFCGLVKELVGTTSEEPSLDWKQIEQRVKSLSSDKRNHMEQTKATDLVGLSGRNG